MTTAITASRREWEAAEKLLRASVPGLAKGLREWLDAHPATPDCPQVIRMTNLRAHLRCKAAIRQAGDVARV